MNNLFKYDTVYIHIIHTLCNLMVENHNDLYFLLPIAIYIEMDPCILFEDNEVRLKHELLCGNNINTLS